MRVSIVEQYSDNVYALLMNIDESLQVSTTDARCIAAAFIGIREWVVRVTLDY